LIVGFAVLGILLSLVLPVKTAYDRLLSEEWGNVGTAAVYLDCWLRRAENFPSESTHFFVVRDASHNWAVFGEPNVPATNGFEVSIDVRDDSRWPSGLRYVRVALKDLSGHLRVEYPAAFRHP
jgi:hypothetical protein